MGEKRTVEVAQAAINEQAAAEAKPEPARKISAVWMSNDPSKDAGQACTKCATRSSSH